MKEEHLKLCLDLQPTGQRGDTSSRVINQMEFISLYQESGTQFHMVIASTNTSIFYFTGVAQNFEILFKKYLDPKRVSPILTGCCPSYLSSLRRPRSTWASTCRVCSRFTTRPSRGSSDPIL